MSDLTSEEGKDLDRVCIVQNDGKRWVSSDGSLKPSILEIGNIYRLMHTKKGPDTEFAIGNRTFYVEKNDGLVLQAMGGKGGQRNEVLCIGRSRKYFVLGGIAASKDFGQCAIEIDFVRSHLKSAGE